MSSNTVQPNDNNMAPKPAFFTYAVRKTLAEGLFDFAMLMANVSQLKALLAVPSKARDDLFVPMLVLIGLSFCAQVVVGVLLVILGSGEVRTANPRHVKMNTSVTVLVFVITVLNVCIAAIGIESSDDGAAAIGIESSDDGAP